MSSIDTPSTAAAMTGDNRIWRHSPLHPQGPELAREEPGDEAAALVLAVGVVDDASCVAQVNDQGDRWVRDHGDVCVRGDTLAEPGHADPRQLA